MKTGGRADEAEGRTGGEARPADGRPREKRGSNSGTNHYSTEEQSERSYPDRPSARPPVRPALRPKAALPRREVRAGPSKRL